MTTARLTSKGQITIPKVVRDALHLCTGDRIDFVLHDENRATLEPVTKTVDDVFGKLHRPGQAYRSVAEMNAAVAERMRKRAR